MHTLIRLGLGIISVLVLSAATPILKYEFNPVATRTQLLSLIDNYQPRELRVEPPPVPGSRAERLIQHYREKIMPKNDRMDYWSLVYSVYSQLIDAGLYENEEERRLWQGKVDEANAQEAAFQTDAQLTADTLEFGRLADGLSGDLPRLARLLAETASFDQFGPEFQSLLVEDSKLKSEVDEIANRSPKKADFERAGPAGYQILLDFFAGKISFDEATQTTEALSQKDILGYGRDIVDKAAAHINRSAVIKTILAKSKGFKTHAELRVARQGLDSREDFKSKDHLLRFLYGLLASTDQVTQRYYEVRTRQLGREFAKLRPSQLALLGFPTFLLMRDYFPRERHADVWKQTMIESGFSKDLLDHLMLDVFPRQNKNNHAYMRPIRIPSLKLLTIDGQTLDPVGVGEDNWTTAEVYILENFKDDGLNDLRIAFHEGGHFLDYSHQRDPLGHSTPYGYSETHSNTMEGFIADREFLLAHGETRSGQRVSEETVDLFLKRKQLSELMAFRDTVAMAIFDIELWDYDYEAGPVTFIERAAEIDEKINRRSDFLKTPEDLPLKNYYSRFLTGHFRSGLVRYSGYVLAKVSAGLMTDALYKKLGQQTGRNSLYQQPQLASMLIDGIYRYGMNKPFPQTVEEFSGRSFSPEAYAEKLVAQVQAFVDELERAK